MWAGTGARAAAAAASHADVQPSSSSATSPGEGDRHFFIPVDRSLTVKPGDRFSLQELSTTRLFPNLRTKIGAVQCQGVSASGAVPAGRTVSAGGHDVVIKDV